jgi:hypothetical protein
MGNAMTFKILMEEGKVIHRAGQLQERGRSSTNKPTNQPRDHQWNRSHAMMNWTQKNETIEEESTTEGDEAKTFKKALQKDIVRSRQEQAIRAGKPLLNIDTSALRGRTFINDPDEKREQTRAKIDDIAPTGDWTADRKHQLFRFQVKIGERKFEKIPTYNKMLEWYERDMHLDGYFKIDGILDHRKDKEAGFGHVVLVQWGDGMSVHMERPEDDFRGRPYHRLTLCSKEQVAGYRWVEKM